jgi:phosphoglycerate dehydrogenase-like enzyme
MIESAPDITKLRHNPHGLSTGTYASELLERLPDATIQVARTPAEEQELIAKTAVVSGTRIEEPLLKKAEQLRLFAGVAAGYDHLPLEQMREMGVAATNASGIHAPNIAEQVLGYLLMFTRRLHEGQHRTERGEWRHYQAYELKDSTITIIGLGAIGTAVTQHLAGFDIDTTGVCYTQTRAAQQTK